MTNTTVPVGLDADQQDSAQVGALAGSQVHPGSALPSRTNAEWGDATLLARFGAKRIQADGELKVCFNPLDLAALLAYTRRAAAPQPFGTSETDARPVDYQTAIDSVYPVPDSPHASVMQRAHDNRIAFSFGWQMANSLAKLAEGAGWTAASNPPDADTTVMLALTDGEVWQGYWNGENWIEVSGLVVTSRVKYWQHTPKHPEDQS